MITGAGMSTDSGIPDYRGPNAPKATPMLYAEFVGSAANRRRYWARAFQGWQRMGNAKPNAGHYAVAELENQGRMSGLITQNVDGLHEAAGSRNLVAIHGRISGVICLDCGRRTSRRAIQARLGELNPDVVGAPTMGHAELRPDGDAVVDQWQDFVVADCAACGGVLKPDVVFFGENVPKQRALRCQEMVEDADLLVVLGSSLTVMSGLRFVRLSAQRNTPVLIINRGSTRGDPLATVKLDLGCTEFLTDPVIADGELCTPERA